MIEHARRQHARAGRRRRVHLVLERFWIEPQRDGRVVVERRLARVAQQPEQLSAPRVGCSVPKRANAGAASVAAMAITRSTIVSSQSVNPAASRRARVVI